MIIIDLTSDGVRYSSWLGIYDAAVAIDAMCERRGLTGIVHNVGTLDP